MKEGALMIDEKKEIIDIFEQNSFILDKKHSGYANYIFDNLITI